MATYETSFSLQLIYVYRINDSAHMNCLKVGQTTAKGVQLGAAADSAQLNELANNRIKQQTQVAGIKYELLHTQLTAFSKSNGKIGCFNDKNIHDILLNSGIKRKHFDNGGKTTEWFETDLNTVKKAIAAAKEGRASLTAGEVTRNLSPIVFRPEQEEAINKTVKRFRSKDGKRMLWNAKMRFGKTLSALEVVKRMKYRRTLIVTHRPVVDDGWHEDFEKIFYDHSDYSYCQKGAHENFSALEAQAKEGKMNYIYFASIQDLRGSEMVGGKFSKNEDVYNVEWDMLIIDEAHEGTTTTLGEDVIKLLTKEKTRTLQLSGTPFNLLDDVKEDEMFTWDYVMEQREKRQWDIEHPGEHNPYASLPTLSIYTYDLGTLIDSFQDDEKAFNFKEFFRTCDDEPTRFVHEQDIVNFLNLMCSDSQKSLYPFSNQEFRDNFRHTLWMVPGVKAAAALSILLKEHPIFGVFNVANVAGAGDEEENSDDALAKVRSAITDSPENTYSITLSCGRLTTGVSVKEWTAVFMLSGQTNTSAAAYMQTIFRVQTPATIAGKMKTDCFVFDFAPDRTLTTLAEAVNVSSKAGKTTEAQRRNMGEFINYCSIISMEGSAMKPLKVETMMQHLKRAYVEHVVRNGFEDNRLYTDELWKLENKDLSDFDNLKRIIGTTKASPKTGNLVINDQGFDNETHAGDNDDENGNAKGKSKLSEAEKKKIAEKRRREENRRAAISILRGISIRMPLLIYGAELENEEENLTLERFVGLIDADSWNEFMPRGVTKKVFRKFMKYYDEDIFAAAAKRIRSLALAADKLSIEERIERITSIFNTFRNPDKETVLTPWRVVNMHMADTLGGWCFYAENFPDTPLPEPRYVMRGAVTAQTFSPTARVLEINSKSGLYPLYVTYNIYRRRLQKLKLSKLFGGEISFEEQHELWNKTVAENVFVLCMTPMAKAITRRTLLGFNAKLKANLRYEKNLLDKLQHHRSEIVAQIRNGKSYWKTNKITNMKFDAVVGNPPYQMMDGGAGASAKPIYNLFVELAKSLEPKDISMIMPAKWYTDGKGLDTFRETMLNDVRIAKLVDFTDSRDCFETVDIAGGICYFLWANNYEGPCEFVSKHQGRTTTAMRKLSADDSFIRHMEAVGIVDKVKGVTDAFYSTKVSAQKPFGLRTYVMPLEDGDIILKCNKGKGPYQSALIIVGKEMISQWKVTISCLTAEHAGQTDKEGRKRILSSLDMLEPNEICTETYLVVDAFDTKEEAEHLRSYLKTRFVRFLIAQLASTQHLSKEKFAFVPLQDFSKNTSIDWTKSVGEIDEQLFAYYGLTETEQAFIKSTIKEM